MKKNRIQKSIIDRCKWRGRMSGGNWAYGSLDMEHYITATIRGIDERTKYPILQIVDTNTLGQYIGHKDKNKIEIYEGDILDIECNNNLAVVKWNKNKGFFVEYLNGFYNRLTDISIQNSAIVGNIYDNPELLKE